MGVVLSFRATALGLEPGAGHDLGQGMTWGRNANPMAQSQKPKARNEFGYQGGLTTKKGMPAAEARLTTQE